jgi:hypothetical protein
MVTADREVIRQILANVLKSADKTEELRALILSTIKLINVHTRHIEVTYHSGRKEVFDNRSYG